MEPRSSKELQYFDDEIESHVILRLPVEEANNLRRLLNESSRFSDKLKIQFEPDMRHASVWIEGKKLKGSLLDLPCIIESLKTLDKKNFFKVTDVSQLLDCKAEVDDSESVDKKQPDPSSADMLSTDKAYHFPHGITPPLKNVRKRRFRKTMKKKFLDAPEIEKELKRLLRADLDANSITWKIVDADAPSSLVNPDLTSTSSTAAPLSVTQSESNLPAAQSSEMLVTKLETVEPVIFSTEKIDEKEIFGSTLSSSSSEDELNEPPPLSASMPSVPVLEDIDSDSNLPD